ncbi:MAG: Bug family tripartite tricarboxylate transporter substrate binding protein [Candidatus Binatia bacterium]
MKAIFSLVTVFLVLLLNADQAPGGSESFFKGKKIRLIVSSTPGGGNDTYSRLIARHISKYIPGNPTMIVQNMPGAGGLLAADYLYRKAPRDGTVMEQINWGVWNYQVIKDPRARFDFNKMNALGVAAIENSLIYSRKDRFKSLDDIRRSGKLAKVGVSGRQSTGHVIGNIIEKITGAKLFEFVFGYPGARQYSLAVRQGEVDVSGNTKSSFLDQLGDMWKAGELVILAQAGKVDGKKDPMFPEAPLLKELAKTPEGKEMAEATFLLSHYGRPYSLPPGVPQDRVKLLRDAFWKTMKDPKFLAEAKRLRRPILPTHGKKLQQMWKDALNAPPKQVEIVRRIFGGKK